MASETQDRPIFDTLQACVEDAMERWTVPGMAVAILKDGEVEAHGFGITSLETKQPVTANTLFQIGSISKVYTATLVMRLVEEGLLDLDAAVSTYLPELRLADERALRSISLRHLLSHTSGLEGDRFTDYGMGDDAISKAVAEFNTLRQLTPPGELWTYCNSGFYLAGAVVERVTGQTFETAMSERLLKPLGSERAFFFAHEAITYPVAVGHSKKPDEPLEIARPYPLPRCVNAAGGIISTVEELLRFAKLHLNGGEVDGTRLLSETSVRAMQEQQTRAANFAEAYGIGWALRTVDGARIVEHGGSTNGFQAQLTLVPDRRFAIAMLTNGSRGSAANRDVEDWALLRHLGLRRTGPAVVSRAAEELALFAGRYEQPHGNLTVAVHNGGLQVEIVMKSPITNDEVTLPPVPLVPISDLEFLVTSGEYEGMRVDFIPGVADRPRFIRLGGRLADWVD